MQCWITAFTPEQVASARLPPFTYETEATRQNLVKENDIVIFCDEDRVVAAAQVEGVTTSRHEEVIPCCPQCNVARLHLRKRKPTLPYMCFYGHEFVAPVQRARETLVHVVALRPKWARIGAKIQVAELRPFELTKSRHVKIRPADVDAVCEYIARCDRKAASILQIWMEARHKEVSVHGQANPTRDVSLGPEESASAIKSAHCGSNDFRDRLIARYGARCMISGSTVLALLKGCPISRQKGLRNFHPTNGLVLRADLCSLFDRNLIGLDPDRLQFTIHPALAETEYQEFAGRRVVFPRHKGIDLRAVRRRWEEFQRRGSEDLPASSPQ